MESPTLELLEVFKEDVDESGDVFGCLFGGTLRRASVKWSSSRYSELGTTYHMLAIVGVGEADTNRLVDEEDICPRVP